MTNEQVLLFCLLGAAFLLFAWGRVRYDVVAVLAVAIGGSGGIEVIVTSARLSPNDPAYFALHGIDPARLGLLCVKAKNHFRAVFAETFAAILDVDTPGPAAPDLARLPFRRVPPERLPPG